MKHEELLKLIPAGRERDFLTFLETGEASDAFLDLMDKSPACQKAVDLALSQQVTSLRGLVQALSELPAAPVVPPPEDPKGYRIVQSVLVTGGGMAHAGIPLIVGAMDPLAVREGMEKSLRQMLALDPAQRIQVMEGAIARLDQPDEAKRMFNQL